MAAIRFSLVSKTYAGAHAAVKDLTLEIEDGEFLVPVGPSGCGKSKPPALGSESANGSLKAQKQHLRRVDQYAQFRTDSLSTTVTGLVSKDVLIELSKGDSMPVILNVMDDLGRYKSLGNGLYESGYWYRPPLGCETIRLYKRSDDPSFLGGRILSERIEEINGTKRKIFTFQDEDTEHGIRRPGHFGPAGCLRTIE